MGAEPPFLYDPPARRHGHYGGFNPKAISQSSLQPPVIRIKQEGPLVNFNKHPDSYVVPPYGNTNARPMSRNTKKKVKYVRWVQLFLRCCELAGAIGLLFLVICVRKVDAVIGWILRIPVNNYYSSDRMLKLNANGASFSKPGVAILHTIYAVYHLARSSSGRTPASSASYMLFSGTADASLIPFNIFCALMSKAQYLKGDDMVWTSLFEDRVADSKIVYATYLSGIVNGSMFFSSLALSLYLAVIFRKISRLPPDMNPLEDNLTSRHKKKNSSVTENRTSQLTNGSSDVGLSKRDSHTQEPLIAPPRTVPFMHTRNSSKDSMISSKNSPASNRNSRADLPSQLQYNDSARSSRVDLNRSTRASSPTKRSSYHAESTPPKHNSHNSLLNDNWYTYLDNSEPEPNESVSRAESTISTIKSFGISRTKQYQPLEPECEDVPHPLEQNPPTPPPGAQRGLRVGNLNRVPTLKAKYYGDLKSATPPIMVGPSADASKVDGNWRVVSNSGTDYDGRREVSGKVAEEGRGSGWTRFRRVSGV
ncbi:MAG: hypothetical protein M1837_003854 [Sclerophora amabilis]|nr:MAG: hypothetical protein M1837_003854 [Sclerophora amabilis]